ncbi:ADP-ribosylation factor-like protein 11 [Colossoma macropomum]|uniref:ADP-ribosylation factor-like protein 11 n=1 Tax=Colossoma macropomum TaxID=42526 RepID=UPI001863C276|nr:ADP-ribosylation factor-like protein 11 [Colossoma macropomum]
MGPMLSKKFLKTRQVVLMGLDSAGKSTLLYRIHRGVVMQTSPTIGFNVVTLELDKKTVFTVWDIGGQGSMRANWKYYLENCEALVFVVDAGDRTRMEEAKTALKKVLSDHNMADIPLMVLANKSDLPDAMTVSEVSKQLDMDSYKDRVWEIQACSALRGQGLQQAFQSVAKLIQTN